MRAYFVLDRMELLRAQRLEVLRDILVRQVTAQKHRMDEPVRTGKLRQCPIRLAFLQHLEQSLQIEPRRRTAHDPLPTQLQRPGVRVRRGDLLDGIDSRTPGEFHGSHQRIGPRTRNTVPRSRTHAQSENRRLRLLEIRPQPGHGARGPHSCAEHVDLGQLVEDLRARPADMRLPVVVVLVLVWVQHVVGSESLAASVLDAASFVERLRLRRPAK